MAWNENMKTISSLSSSTAEVCLGNNERTTEIPQTCFGEEVKEEVTNLIATPSSPIDRSLTE